MIYQASVVGANFSDRENSLRENSFVSKVKNIKNCVITKQHSDYVILKCDITERDKIKDIIKRQFDNVGYIVLAH